MNIKISFNYYKIWKFILISTIISVALENIKIFSVLGTAFKPTHVIFIAAIMYSISQGKIRRDNMIVCIFFLLLPMLPLYRISDTMEWFKSYVIYAIMIIFITFSLRYFILEFSKNARYYILLLLRVIAITQVLGIIQFILMNYFGYFFLKDIFGSFQFHSSIYGMQGGYYRAYSIYHEPSVFGWVTTSSVAILLFIKKDFLRRKEQILFWLLDCVSIIVSVSSSCLAIFVILLVVNQFVKTTNIVKTIGSLILLCIVAILLWNFTDYLAPLQRIFSEITVENTSGYERIISPILYVQKTFDYYPIFGRGIGQEGGVDAVGTIGLYAGINNSLIGIIANFGLSALCFYVPIIILAIKKIRKNRMWLILIVNLLGIYATSGAYIAMDTFIFLVLLLSIGNIEINGNVKERYKYESFSNNGKL